MSNIILQKYKISSNNHRLTPKNTQFFCFFALCVFFITSPSFWVGGFVFCGKLGWGLVVWGFFANFAENFCTSGSRCSRKWVFGSAGVARGALRFARGGGRLRSGSGAVAEVFVSGLYINYILSFQQPNFSRQWIGLQIF